MLNKCGHGIQARITIDDIPQAQLNLLNSSTVTYEISDESSGVIESSVTKPMQSFTANFLRLLWGRMTGTACTGGLDINDTAIDESSGKATNLKCVGATTGLKKFGICIGTGTGAVAQTDNKLTWDTGFTTYGATTLKTATTISGSEIYFEIQKQFVNSTGSSRTIYEAGLCTTGEGTEADNNTNVLIAREITNGATGTAVATGKTLTVVFKISSTFTTDGTINRDFMEQLESAFLNYSAENWKTRSTSGYSARAGHAMVSHNGSLYLIGGDDGSKRNSVYSSVDKGKTWVEVRADGAASGFTARSYHTSLSFNGLLWVIGGRDASNRLNDVWYSSDNGATWTQATASAAWSVRELHASVSYGGKMWVAGGRNGATNYNDVYYSTDGVTWTQATASAAWATRHGQGMLVHSGKMWIMGGLGASFYNDVYYSTDGATWTQATASAAWAGRRMFGFVSTGLKMYVIGGSSSGIFSDIYSSSDGVTWTAASKTFSRQQFGISLLNGMACISGGYDGSSTLKNDSYTFCDPIFDLDTATTMSDYARIDAASGSVYGITVGTGTTNFAGTDAALVTPIADGSSASQLDYGDMTDAGRLSEPTVSGSDNVMRLERDFANNSGGSITIKEVGLSAKGIDALGLLLMRGKVDKAVADGASVRVAIELITSV